MKVLVTGASGFIGRALCKRLVERGDTVIGTGRTRHAGIDSRVEFIQADMNDPKELMNLQVDVIFHLAANPNAWYAQQHPVEDFLTNALGTVRVLELAKKCNARLVLPSSISLYAGGKEMFKEDDLQITSFYAASKRTAEIYCKQYHDSFGVKTAVVRFSYVYGKGVTRGPIADILKGGPLFANADTIIDFVHVSDAVDALLKVADKEGFGIYNIGSGKGISVHELLSLMKSNVKPNNQKPKFRLVLDTTLARKELGWEPKVSLEEGLCDL